MKKVRVRIEETQSSYNPAESPVLAYSGGFRLVIVPRGEGKSGAEGWVEDARGNPQSVVLRASKTISKVVRTDDKKIFDIVLELDGNVQGREHEVRLDNCDKEVAIVNWADGTAMTAGEPARVFSTALDGEGNFVVGERMTGGALAEVITAKVNNCRMIAVGAMNALAFIVMGELETGDVLPLTRSEMDALKKSAAATARSRAFRARLDEVKTLWNPDFKPARTRKSKPAKT